MSVIVDQKNVEFKILYRHVITPKDAGRLPEF
jgi:hypothetical protein